jgi:hypothetical protein
MYVQPLIVILLTNCSPNAYVFRGDAVRVLKATSSAAGSVEFLSNVPSKKKFELTN